MSNVENVRSPARRFVRAILPNSLVDAVRDAYIRARYQRSMVSREPRWVVWFRRVVLRRKPVLFHFEVHITDHCNLNCKGCAHFSNLCPPTFADLAEFESDMQHMANTFSRVRQIYLLGGEPLLHPKVGEFCKSARNIFPKSRIYLMTNGTMVMRMDEKFWNDLAESKVILLCDSYPIDLPKIEINLMGKQHHVKVEWTVPRKEFFKIPIDPQGGHDAASSFDRCKGFNNCPIIRDGQLYPCAYVAFADVFRDKFGVGGLQVYPTDSIGIRNEPDPEQVIEFLSNPVHWCSNCDMDKREFYDWGRSTRDISEWTCVPPPQAQRPAAAVTGRPNAPGSPASGSTN
jgi:hypothetical protein